MRIDNWDFLIEHIVVRKVRNKLSDRHRNIDERDTSKLNSSWALRGFVMLLHRNKSKKLGALNGNNQSRSRSILVTQSPTSDERGCEFEPLNVPKFMVKMLRKIWIEIETFARLEKNFHKVHFIFIVFYFLLISNSCDTTIHYYKCYDLLQ